MNLPLDVINIVALYLVKPKMKLLDWIKLNWLDWNVLSANPNAIDLLEENKHKIDWYELSANPNGIKLLNQHRDKINVPQLCSNPNGTYLLKAFMFPKMVKHLKRHNKTQEEINKAKAFMFSLLFYLSKFSFISFSTLFLFKLSMLYF